MSRPAVFLQDYEQQEVIFEVGQEVVIGGNTGQIMEVVQGPGGYVEVDFDLGLTHRYPYNEFANKV